MVGLGHTVLILAIVNGLETACVSIVGHQKSIRIYAREFSEVVIEKKISGIITAVDGDAKLSGTMQFGMAKIEVFRLLQINYRLISVHLKFKLIYLGASRRV